MILTVYATFVAGRVSTGEEGEGKRQGSRARRERNRGGGTGKGEEKKIRKKIFSFFPLTSKPCALVPNCQKLNF